MIKAINEAEARKQTKEKQRTSSRIQKERKIKIEEIENLITEKGIKVEELGKYSNYKEQINNLNKVWEIQSLAEEIRNYIWDEIISKKLDDESRA